MNITTPVYLLSATNIAFLVFLFLADNGKTNIPENQLNTISMEIGQLKESLHEVKELNLSLQEQISYMPNTTESSEYTVMSNSQVRKLLSEIIESQQKTDVSLVDFQANKQQTISYEQQLRYDEIAQQVDTYNSNSPSFHELMKKENIGGMPEEYRNKILSRLVNKLNSGEIDPNAVLGLEQ